MCCPRYAAIAIPVATVSLLHVTILTGLTDYAVSAIALGPAAHLLTALARGGSRRHIVVLAAVVAALAGLQALVLFGDGDLARVVMVPPVIVHAWLAWMFGRTLLPGREPLIRRFSRFSRGQVPAELMAYTRRLTILWTIMFALMAVVSAAVGALAEPDVWSWAVNIGMPAFAALAFLADHAYRAVAYRHLGHNSPIGTLRTLTRIETWTAP